MICGVISALDGTVEMSRWSRRRESRYAGGELSWKMEHLDGTCGGELPREVDCALKIEWEVRALISAKTRVVRWNEQGAECPNVLVAVGPLVELQKMPSR